MANHHLNRRNRLEIFYDLLTAIKSESERNGNVKPTRVQHKSNMSYDKMTIHFKEMENFGLITKKNGGPKITEKGQNYLLEYIEIDEVVREIEKKYFMSKNHT